MSNGREVLIVEDEPLISLEIAQAFRKVGAFTTITSTLKQALNLDGARWARGRDLGSCT
jgi:DNA-binding response OmpR family regulator